MTIVTCAIILIEGKILVTQRSASMKQPLKWEFPGGKLEEGEDEMACIKREIKEELAIDIRILQRLNPSVFDYGDFQITLIPFLADYEAGTIHLAEHAQYRLLDKAELLDLDWAAADVPIVEEISTMKI